MQDLCALRHLGGGAEEHKRYARCTYHSLALARPTARATIFLTWIRTHLLAGLKPDVLFVFDIKLPESFVPAPLDGEVCWHAGCRGQEQGHDAVWGWSGVETKGVGVLRLLPCSPHCPYCPSNHAPSLSPLMPHTCLSSSLLMPRRSKASR